MSKRYKVLIILSLLVLLIVSIFIAVHIKNEIDINMRKTESFAIITEGPREGASGNVLITVHTDEGYNYYFSIDKTKLYGADGKRADATMLEEETRIRFIYENAMQLGIVYDENGNPGPYYLYNCYEIHIIDE